MNNEIHELNRPFCSENVTYCKAILSTNVLRLIEIIPNDPSQFGKPRKRKGGEKIENEEILRKRAENKKWMTDNGRFLSSITRSRTKVFEHVCNNFAHDAVFVTPTYNIPLSIDRYDEALKHFDLFRRKLNRELGELRYLAIAELQPKSKRIHFHMLIDRIKIDKKLLENLWGHGFVKVKEVYGKPASIAHYITKYMTKETIIPFGRKSYLCSRNLKKSFVINDFFGAYALAGNLQKQFECEKSTPYAFESYVGAMQITKMYFPDLHLHDLDLSMYNNQLTKKPCNILSTLANPQKAKIDKSNRLPIKSTS